METVKIVKGHAITRAIGCRGFYHVTVEEGETYKKYRTFRTIKAAAEFIERTF